MRQNSNRNCQNSAHVIKKQCFNCLVNAETTGRLVP